MNSRLKQYVDNLLNNSLKEQAARASVPKKQVNGVIYPDDATYALKRRMIVPKWWVESVLLTLGKKYPWYSSFISNYFGKEIYEYFKASSTNMFFMIALWDELVRQMFAAPNHNITKIKINLTKFLIGTEKQNTTILKTLEENLIKPIKIFKVSQIEQTKEAEFTKNGYLNIFKKVVLVQDVNDISLTLHFAQNPFNIFGSPNIKSKKHNFKNCFITINPNLFYAMGSRVNLKKALNGLFLEYNKQNEGLDPLHTSFSIETAQFREFHAHASATARTLYNHGILDIVDTPPSMKISTIKARQKKLAPEERSPLVFSWHLSSQSKRARNFEAKLSEQLNSIRQTTQPKPLFHEPPKDELQVARVAISDKKPENIPPVVEQTTVKDTPVDTPPVDIPTPSPQTETPHSPFKFLNTPKPNFHAFSERELSIFVTRFYESLNPKQKKMFESERRSMTREQFRSFMIPILQRTHATLPT